MQGFQQVTGRGRTGGCNNKGGHKDSFHWRHAPPAEFKINFRRSEIKFPSFWASKRVLFMIIFIDP